MVEGAVICAEKDPGFFAALRMTQKKRRNPESRAFGARFKILLLSRPHSQIILTGTFSGTAPWVPIALSGNLSAIQIFPGVSAVTNPRGLI